MATGRCDLLLMSPSVVSREEVTDALIQPLAKCIVARAHHPKNAAEALLADAKCGYQLVHVDLLGAGDDIGNAVMNTGRTLGARKRVCLDSQPRNPKYNSSRQ